MILDEDAAPSLLEDGPPKYMLFYISLNKIKPDKSFDVLAYIIGYTIYTL